MALKKGTAGANTLKGTAAADTLLGLGGNDTLLGLDGSDSLNGGTGRDRMSGGRGNDLYFVDRADDIVVERAGEGTDTISSTVSLTLPGTVERLILTGTKAINGTGNALGNIITGNEAKNTLNGGDGNDSLVGKGGDDRLLGGKGNDRLDGGKGADKLEGGVGNDVYVIDRAADKVIEATGAGTDTVFSSAAIAMPANIERLVLTGNGNINQTGDAKSNAIAGNAGNNVINAGTGNDLVLGGSGSDSLIGGAGNDRLDGGSGDDSLAGGGDRDTLVGGTGNDVLDGGSGADSLVGGSGNDTYVIDNVGDRATDADPGSIVIFPGPTSLGFSAFAAQMQGTFAALTSEPKFAALASDGGIDEVRSATISIDVATVAAAGGIEIVRLFGDLDLNITGDTTDTATITLIGNAGVNTIVGQAGDDVIDGGGGGDRMIGGDGDDTYTVDDANDVPVESVGEGNDTIVVTGDTTLDDFANFENIAGSGDGDLILFGDDNANTIAGADGDDTIFAGAGDDSLAGAAGDDTLEGQVGNDSIAGGAGIDRAVFGGTFTDYTIAVANGVTTVADNNSGDGDDGSDTVATVERLVFADQTVLAPVGLDELDGANGFKITGQADEDGAGISVASAGDVNGDGFADLIIGAYFNDIGVDADAGAAYVVFGKATGFGTVDLDAIQAGNGGFKILGELALDHAGFAVAGAGDVNGDGLADMVVGSYRFNGGANDQGVAYVVFGVASGVATVDLGDLGESDAGFKMIGEQTFDFAGFSVASAGDINGDGFADLLVGANRNAYGVTEAGATYVVFGKATGFSDVNLAGVASGTGGFKIIGQDNGDRSGASVASAGDVNGDGLSDIIVGSYNNGEAGIFAGAAYVVFGKTTGFATVDLDDVALGTGGFKILAEAAGDSLGRSVASAGDVDGDGFDDMVIGAIGNGTTGAAYVVFGTDAVVTNVDLAQVALGNGGFKMIGAATGDFAGRSVASAGDVNGDGYDDIIVGADAADQGGSYSGAGFVVFGGGTPAASVNLGDIAKGVGGFLVFGEDAGDKLGRSVASVGDMNGDGFDDLVMGAPSDNDGVDFDIGAGFVLFGRDFEGEVTHPGTAGDDVLTGDVDFNILVGGLGDDTLDGGAGEDVLIGGGGDDLLIFDASDTKRVDGGGGFDTLVVQGAGVGLDLTTINAGAHFNLYEGVEGIDITGTGDNSLTFALRDLLSLSDDSNFLNVDADAGDVVGGGGGWTQHANATIGGTAYAIYTQGGATLQVGLAADRADFDIAAFDMAGIADLGGFKIIGETTADIAGRAVASAGDINGDGFADLIVGAYLNDANALANAGAAYVVFGKASGFGPVNLDDVALGTGGFKILGESASDYAGFSVSSAGDFNGDGFADLFVGAYLDDDGGTNAGAAYVVFGKSTGLGTVNLGSLSASDGFKIVGEAASDLAGRAVASAGDVNGDGLSDIILGAYRDDQISSDSGAAYVIMGKSAGFGTVSLSDIAAGTGGFKLLGEGAFADAGFRVSSAGDFDGDGFADVLVSSVQDGTGGSQAGAAYLVFGSQFISGSISLGLAAGGSGGFKIIGQDTRDFAGYSLASAGDINGDGLDDIVIGADYADAGGAYSGAAYVVFGTATPPASVDLDAIAVGTGGFMIFGEAASDFAGASVSSAGDVNGDGLEDVLIGANGNDAQPGAGAAYVVFGVAGGLTGVNLDEVAKGNGGFKLLGETRFDGFGKAVSGAGDVDGDGFDDIIVGAYDNDAGGSAAGASYVFFGRDFTRTVTHQGTAAGETLTGTAGGDIILGGQGDDTLIGGADSDVLLGGAGDDVLVFDGADGRATEGGTGFDTLRVLDDAATVDLTAINNVHNYSLFTGIEAIDLAATGNTLTLDIKDLVHLSDTSNTLLVDGDGDDFVTTSDGGWGTGVADADFAGYTTYTHTDDIAKLIVDTAIDRSGIVAV